MSDVAAQIEQGLTALGDGFVARFAAAQTEQDLRTIRAEVLGKKGELTNLLRQMGQVSAEQRKQIGERANAVKAQAETAFEGRLAELAKAAREQELQAPPFDLTLPARPLPRGHLHVIGQAMDDILDVFASLGFQIGWGPEVELENNNFTKLNFPPDHPATDMQDSFWVKVDGAAQDARLLLRTHTSTVQIRELSRHRPPLAVVSGGRVYRRDDDVTHSPMFHQIEGFMVDEAVSFAQLKGVLTTFAKRLYGESVAVRFRPSFFPFVEPGAELDVDCVFCNVTDGSRASCRVCKGSGWLEVLGCGMIHPNVLEACGIDASKYTGFAFGLGVERVAMLRHGIPDIRLLFESDPRFLAQF
ncbi:MAG TPA: phenylalanine--tRNA ligase subunit alpha [Polyangiaceae bacterium]|jgi:phenylalanyl-tRNA synthetase alpha chain|nr:phenylalanine--tRNA ligase subunit alpha [Polyangiaceae bacterium]